VPLWILAVGAIVAGYVGLPKLWVGKSGNLWEHWLEPVMYKEAHEVHASPALEWGAMALSVCVALFGIWLATKLYRRYSETPKMLAGKAGGLYRLVLDKYRVDEIYSASVIRPLIRIADGMSWFDKWIVDGAVNMHAHVSELSGHLLKFIQTGYIRNYALFLFLALLVIVCVVVF